MSKKKSSIKLLISFSLCVALLFTIGITPCYADSAGLIRAKSWIASAITACNIFLQPLNYAGTHAVQNAVDPFNIVSTIQEQDYAYYMDKSTIKIYPNSVTIDGVPYTDIWLSYDAANKFRTEALDFATAYSLASNTNATYADGVGYINNLPVFLLSNGTRVTQAANFSVGDSFSYAGSSYISDQGIGTVNVFLKINGTTASPYQSRSDGENIIGKPAGFRYENINSSLTNGYKSVSTPLYPNFYTFGSKIYFDGVLQDFDFDYVSGEIPATVLDPNDGLYLRIPSSHSNTTHTDRSYDIDDFVDDYPDITNYTFDFDPYTNPNYDIDLDLNDALGNLISAIIAAYLLDLLNDPNTTIEYTIDPEPQPVVDDTIAETKYSVLDQILQSIKDVLDNILESIEEWFNSIKDVLDDILDQIIEDLYTIKSYLQSIYSTLSTIPSLLQTLFSNLADRILQDIEEGPIKLLDKLLDVLRTLFFPILATLKSFLGIWHYVVTWMGNISAPFTWIMGLMAGASPILISPIYALIAGIIVIAVYRRFGR